MAEPGTGGNTETSPQKEISVVIPVVERFDNLRELYLAISDEVKKLTPDFEVIFVIDGHMKRALKEIERFSPAHPDIRTITFTRTLGESVALSVGFESSRGRYVFTSASYFQVDPKEIGKLYESLVNDECDIVISKRRREKDSFFNRLQSSVFHRFLKLFTGSVYSDISCGFRGIKRDALRVVDIYGDLHRFIPILAEHHGLRVREVEVAQRTEDTKARVYNPRVYINRAIDVLTLFFLIRFAYKPLRFFGLLGTALMLSGIAVISYLIYMRLTSPVFALGDKPALFLASILVVLGIQVFAVGIIGEIIIYTHSKGLKRYNIREIIE